MPSLSLEADYKNLPPSRVAICEEDASALGVETGDLCSVSDDTGLQLGGARAIIEHGTPKGRMFMEADSAQMIGVEKGFTYALEPIPAELLLSIKRLVLEVTAGDAGADIGSGVLQDHERIAGFLQGRVINAGMRLRWREYGYELVVKDTAPKMSGGQFAVISESVELELEETASPFHGIMLLDSSASMLEKDITVGPDVKPLLAPLYLVAETALPDIAAVLQKMEVGGSLSRLDSALLGIFLFISEKKERGLGEKIAVVEYGDRARYLGPLDSDGLEPFFKIGPDGPVGFRDGHETRLEGGLRPGGPMTGGGGTNVETAFELALRALDRLMEGDRRPDGRTRPVVMVLVSDGSYAAGQSPAAVVGKRLKPLQNLVLHTISVGKEADAAVLARCAELGRGSHVRAQTLEDVIRFFSTKARYFGMTQRTGTAAKGTVAQTHVLEACPKCGKEDFVRSVESRENRMFQVVTCSVCGHRQEKLTI